ncbi:uncharacterized protein MELLADRAFT_90883 [Melampsora larici-populina 98AG31]|uniref:DUF7918 domain-containing protein n=1 Tax=Melampsora larici-populina (strain 98AG31 / pathotype 3-4-7) TaxID=747676 RepID=F4R7V5_MELLP|nr:uncharacterized protein MELLADRAFT_90883 [Melampsora larici-populina 98AG31]EGG11721.1 hypothetical protein MELLADRAFT_90883 [Melampsora larici-populina 98AG31]
MPQSNDVQANLICNGIPLTEYTNPANWPFTVFCESTPDQTFQVKLSGPKSHYDCIVRLYCDGVLISSFVYPRHVCSFESTFHGIYLPGDDTKLMPFKFSKIELSEEDDSHPEQIAKNLGTVSVEFFRCTLGPQRPSNNGFVPSLASTSKLSERNKQASMIPHIIGLGQSTSAPINRSSIAYSTREVHSTPYLRFVWKYRSRSMLISAGFIPPTVSPLPLPDIQLQSPPRLTSQSGPSSDLTRQETKPEVKPKTSASKSLVIDLCDDKQPTKSFSSYENPILLDDDDDDEQILYSPNKLTQTSSSSAQQVDSKPVKLESVSHCITDVDTQLDQTKRVMAKTEVDEIDQKRVKQIVEWALQQFDASPIQEKEAHYLDSKLA